MADAAGSLHAQLAAEKAKVTTLTNQIGTATDTANAAESASLYAQLKAAKAKVTKLTGEIGDTTTPNSLKARLATAQAEGDRRWKGQLLCHAEDEVSQTVRQAIWLQTLKANLAAERQRADDANERARRSRRSRRRDKRPTSGPKT